MDFCLCVLQFHLIFQIHICEETSKQHNYEQGQTEVAHIHAEIAHTALASPILKVIHCLNSVLLFGWDQLLLSIRTAVIGAT